ncbi:Zn-dependent protease (includes SpoIVFB) [Caloramator quimbayensis]|uniref:Zn-dependent protease (Includes SpoIVFB) n=1 Tax=Caloramator quimbayensis TaxID=1147123 RepID=A0A1T4WXZ2_9CLOT|nr:site-2 protease family protein [Caloramator quimbayensis]SKA82253.1 Zn-dependent protease (includes SpoIVFB) [Caloramator quimbayensis]
MFNYDIAQFLITGIAIIISLSIHEYSHALISTLLGDDVPFRYGRLTLNPLAHIDPIGIISLFLFKFGWAKPVPISSRNYKNRRLGIILTSLSGPISNLLLSFFTALCFVIFSPSSEGVVYFLGELFTINTGLFVFNLIPIPPLDGSKIFAELFGGRIADFIYSLERWGMVLLFALLWIPQVSYFLSFLIHTVKIFILNIITIIL